MASLFKTKKKSKSTSEGAGSGPSGIASPYASSATLPSLAHPLPTSNGKRSGVSPTSSAEPVRALDEFGRAIAHPPPAFASPSPSASGVNGQHPADPHGTGAGQYGEPLLRYGYWGVKTELEIDVATAERAVGAVAEQIRSRGLECPMLFSTKALDITAEGTRALIQSYVGKRGEWSNDIQLASPHNLVAFLKWVLGRHVNPLGTRGFLRWEKYDNWRNSERERGYPPRFVTTHLLYHLPTQTASLLTTLFDLFSTAAAYSAKNGMTVHKSAALFGSYIFGLADDQPFDRTYNAWLKYTHAAEHLILAYIRDQKATSTTGNLPSRLEAYVSNYPACLPTNLSRPLPGARLERVCRISRHARFYNKNLIQSAGTWDVPRCKTWERLQPYPISSRSVGSSSTLAGAPVFTKGYRHLLNFHGVTEAEDEETDIEMQRFRSLVEKEWSGFMSKGFEPPDQSKLTFDLRESERTRRQKHETLDWNAFLGKGFEGRETFLPTDLEFSRNLGSSVASWPEQKQELSRKLHKTTKALPPFPFDITPVEEPSVMVDDDFFEAWADVLVGSGWARDELKECSWVLVQYKARPDGPPEVDLSAGHDGRTEELWFLTEEIVPESYRTELLEGKHTKKGKSGASFLRSVTRGGGSSGKKGGNGGNGGSGSGVGGGGENRYAGVNPGLGQGAQIVPTAMSSFQPRMPIKRSQGDDVFDLRPGETRQLSLSRTDLDSRSFAAPSIYAPSTIAGTIGHGTAEGDRMSGTDPGEAPNESGGRGLNFMASLRAKNKKRQDSYRLAPPSPLPPCPSAFAYEERSVADPEPHLAPPPDGRKPRGSKGPPSSRSAEGWVDVTPTGSSPYGRAAYSADDHGSVSVGARTPRAESLERVVRPSNPSPPGSPEQRWQPRPIQQWPAPEAPARPGPNDYERPYSHATDGRPYSQATDTSYPDANESDDDDYYPKQTGVNAVHDGYYDDDDDPTMQPPRPITGRADSYGSGSNPSESDAGPSTVLHASRIPVSIAGLKAPPPPTALPPSPRAGLPRSPRTPELQQQQAAKTGGLPTPQDLFSPKPPEPAVAPAPAPAPAPPLAPPRGASLRSMAQPQPSSPSPPPASTSASTPTSTPVPVPVPALAPAPKLQNSPFNAKAKKVSSIVDMFESTEGQRAQGAEVRVSDLKFRNTGPAGGPVGVGEQRRERRLSRVGEGRE